MAVGCLTFEPKENRSWSWYGAYRYLVPAVEKTEYSQPGIRTRTGKKRACTQLKITQKVQQQTWQYDCQIQANQNALSIRITLYYFHFCFASSSLLY